MRFIFSLIALLAVAGSALPQANVAATAGTVPAVFEQNRFDFGAVDKGRKVSHSFRFKNVGSNNLEIKTVAPT